MLSNKCFQCGNDFTKSEDSLHCRCQSCFDEQQWSHYKWLHGGSHHEWCIKVKEDDNVVRRSSNSIIRRREHSKGGLVWWQMLKGHTEG
jgi:hypothetical protein